MRGTIIFVYGNKTQKQTKIRKAAQAQEDDSTRPTPEEGQIAPFPQRIISNHKTAPRGRFYGFVAIFVIHQSVFLLDGRLAKKQM
jgi:hypothetical protein